ncbi:GtrA family protein [Nocardioides ultimimeridianus]
MSTLTGLIGLLRSETGRFAVVGGSAFLVDLGAFNLARLVVHLGPLTSKVVAVAVATTFAYVANRAWTFAHRGSSRERIGVAGEYALFFVLNAVGMLIALACLATSYYLLGLRSTLDQNISANGVGLVLGTLFRYWSYRRWVFPETAAEPDDVPVAVEADYDRAAA